MNAATDLLEELRACGCDATLTPATINTDAKSKTLPKLAVRGDLSEELYRRVLEKKPALKLALLLESPPGWLKQGTSRFFAGVETEVRYGDGTEVVRIQPKNIAAAVAEEIGVGGQNWQEVISEVLNYLDACWLKEKVGKGAA
jgi:hypothetical protein